LGQLGGASLSNCRELRAEGDQREAWSQPLRKHRFSSNGNCIAGNQCVRSGLSPKLLSNPFKSVVAYPEALFRRGLSRQGPERSNRRYRAPQSIDQLSSRLLDAREAISSSFAAIFSMVVKSHSDAAHITKRVVSRARP
jgi:hypothetical protein